MAQTSSKGGRPATVYYLNKKQCIFITTKSETAEATEKTIEIVEVYDAVMNGAHTPRTAPARSSATLPSKDTVPVPYKLLSDVLDVAHNMNEEIALTKGVDKATREGRVLISRQIDKALQIYESTKHLSREVAYIMHPSLKPAPVEAQRLGRNNQQLMRIV